MQSKSVDPDLAALGDECRQIEADMSKDIEELEREMEKIRASKDLKPKQKKNALEMYDALLEMAKTVQDFNETADDLIARCDEIAAKCGNPDETGGVEE